MPEVPVGTKEYPGIVKLCRHDARQYRMGVASWYAPYAMDGIGVL